MALAQDRILISIEFDLVAFTINVLWRDRILVDGVEFSGNNHRGAYPVNEQGEVDDYVKTLLGASLQDIIGEACANVQRNFNELLASFTDLQGVVETISSEKENLLHQLAEAGAVLISANARIAELEALHAGAE